MFRRKGKNIILLVLTAILFIGYGLYNYNKPNQIKATSIQLKDFQYQNGDILLLFSPAPTIEQSERLADSMLSYLVVQHGNNFSNIVLLEDNYTDVVNYNTYIKLYNSGHNRSQCLDLINKDYIECKDEAINNNNKELTIMPISNNSYGSAISLIDNNIYLEYDKEPFFFKNDFYHFISSAMQVSIIRS